MKKVLKVTLLSLGGSLLVLGGLACWQYQNIQAAWSGLTTSPEQIQEEIQEVKTQVSDALITYNIKGIRDLTVEEEAKLRSGEITLEEAIDLMVSDKEGNEGEEQDTEDKGNTTDQTNAVKEVNVTDEIKQQVDDVVAQYAAQMYTLKAKYVSLLAGVESRAKSAFFSLPKEQQNLKGLQKIGGSFIGEAMNLESQCNSEVGAMLLELEQSLKALGADTGVVDTMRKAYENEKSLKKAYYLSAFK